MREDHRTGVRYLDEVTTLCRRVRSAHPTAGLFDAADFQWWWARPRPTDDLAQLFWFDATGRPEAAAIVTDWGDTVGLAPIVLPGAGEDWTAQVVARGLAHATELGFDAVEVVIDRADAIMVDVLAAHGFTVSTDEAVEAWIPADTRSQTSPLSPGYRLATRLDTGTSPHHLGRRNGPEVEERLRQTSLYRADLDLVVLDGDGTAAAYGLFWFDPETAMGLVEPMRTEDDHQRRGLGRHVLTVGVNLLADAGARRIKIAYRPDNQPAHALYVSVGFEPLKQCVVLSRTS